MNQNFNYCCILCKYVCNLTGMNFTRVHASVTFEFIEKKNERKVKNEIYCEVV